MACLMRLEPVAAEVEDAPVGPVAGCQEEDEEEERAVEARSVEKIGAEEEEENETRRCVGRNEKQRKPAVEVR